METRAAIREATVMDMATGMVTATDMDTATGMVMVMVTVMV
ncbi:hypothetical protein [Caballeronia fortuita]|nr:hypothetical protein [Caballeronia fortuita]